MLLFIIEGSFMDNNIRTIRNSLFFIIFLLIILVAFSIDIVTNNAKKTSDNDSVWEQEYTYYYETKRCI